jgi:hypothetical protein
VLRRFGRRAVLSTALLAVGGTMPLLAALPAPAVVLLAAVASGAGALVVEVGTETVLQEQLPDEVFARAYGFAFPASIGGIALGALFAAPLIAALGVTGALAAVGGVVACYAVWLRGSRVSVPLPVQ